VFHKLNLVTNYFIKTKNKESPASEKYKPGTSLSRSTNVLLSLHQWLGKFDKERKTIEDINL